MSELPKGWIKTQIKDISLVVGGGTPKTTNKEYFEGDISWITPADLSGYKEMYISSGSRNISELGLSQSSARLLPKGSVLFSSRAPVGYVVIANKEVATNQGFKSMTPSGAFNSEYAYYYLKHIKQYAESQASGTTFKELSGKKFGELEFLLPPLNEQKRIVEKLDRLFANLDSLKTRLDHIPQLLKQFRQSVLTQAVTGKLTEEWREGNRYNFTDTEEFIQKRRKKYYEKKLAEAIKNGEKKPKKLDQSAFEYFAYSDGYALPENWGLMNLKNIADLITDGEHATPKRTDAGYYLLSARNVLNGRLSFKKVDYVPINEFERIKKRCYPEYKDILISCSGTIGRVCSVPKGLEFVMVRSVALIKIQSNTELSGYMETALQSRLVQHQIESLQKATAQANLFIGPIGRIVIPFPPLEEQKEIVRRVEALFAIADNIEERYEKLKAQIDHLPQAILAKAFRGDLVPQDPNDEPAEELMARIQAEREGKTAKPKLKSGAKQVAPASLTEKGKVKESTSEQMKLDI